MIKSVSIYCLCMLSAGIFIAGFYSKDYYKEIIISDNQEFSLIFNDIIAQSEWENYFTHDLEIEKISENVIQILLKDVLSEDVQPLLAKLQQIRYAKLHNVNLIGDMKKKVFEIVVVLTVPQDT